MKVEYHNRKVYKNIKKVCMLIAILSLVFLSGCYEKYDKDYIKLYNRYLKYSLGDYNVLDKQIIKWSGGVVPGAGEKISWELEYINDRNETKVFRFANHGYAGGGDDSNFGYAVLTHAISIGKNQLTNELVKQYFDEDELGVIEYFENATNTSIFVTSEYKIKKYENCVSPKNGIELKSITAKQLAEEWECSFGFKVNTGIEDEKQLFELKEKIEKLLYEFFIYFDDYSITVDLNGEDYEHSYRASYNEETNSFDWQVLADVYEAQKYKDGHLIKVDEIIANGKSISQYDLATYNFDTNEYHIMDYLRFVRELGFEIQETDKYGVYRWKVGGDIFETSNLGKKWYVKKNGNRNLLKYHGYESRGISLSDFEIMTNSTAYFDKDKKAIIINSNN